MHHNWLERTIAEQAGRLIVNLDLLYRQLQDINRTLAEYNQQIEALASCMEMPGINYKVVAMSSMSLLEPRRTFCPSQSPSWHARSFPGQWFLSRQRAIS